MIGGNIKAVLQVKKEGLTNEIGEKIVEWKTSKELWGYLDLMNQTTNRNNFNTKLEESTHIFICDYTPINKSVEDKRMIVDGLVYEVLLIDNPINLNQHLEIYLKFTGGQ